MQLKKNKNNHAIQLSTLLMLYLDIIVSRRDEQNEQKQTKPKFKLA